MKIQSGTLRTGYRAIGRSMWTLADAIARLNREEHLGRRSAIITRNRAGRYTAHVYAGGTGLRTADDQRVTRLCPPRDGAGLIVPDGMQSDAIMLVASL